MKNFPKRCRMRRSDSDLLLVAERELERLDEEELLRLVVLCRDGDEKSQCKPGAVWAELVARDIDRVRGIVAAFRHPVSGTRVAPDDIDQVAQDAYIRLLGMSFRGTSVGEYRSALWRCVTFQCMDHCRSAMEEDKRRSGSLDEQVATDEGDGRPKFEKQIAKMQDEWISEQDQLDRLRERREAMDEAIPKIEDERKRRVLEMTREGCTTDDIAKELGVSEDNVYQLRRRGLKLLQEILQGS
jgi:RNA polymerase sigma factor (sigma-70 family)